MNRRLWLNLVTGLAIGFFWQDLADFVERRTGLSDDEFLVVWVLSCGFLAGVYWLAQRLRGRRNAQHRVEQRRP